MSDAAPVQRYAREFVAGWGTMDFNGHMANTAYLDLAADVRLTFFREHGFPTAEFRRFGLGPVVRRDEVEYFREVGLHDAITVTLAVAALSADAARFTIENDFLRPGGERVARVRSTGGWLDLRARRLAVPPGPLAAAMRLMPRTDDFAELPGLGTRPPTD